MMDISSMCRDRKKCPFYYYYQTHTQATASFKAPQSCFCFVYGFISFFFVVVPHCHSFKIFFLYLSSSHNARLDDICVAYFGSHKPCVEGTEVVK